MTTDCNFKCKYCYEDYHNHYQLQEDTLIESLEFMMNYGDKGKVLIDFLGGEPLLKKDLIYQAVDYIKNNYPKREVKYYITTNCSLMDDSFIDFMKKNLCLSQGYNDIILCFLLEACVSKSISKSVCF